MNGIGVPEILLVVGIALLFALGFLPVMIAWNKKDFWGIAITHLLVGWTGIGWIVTLIWAFRSPKKDNWFYTCDRCNKKVGSIDKLKVFVCPQCGNEETF